MTASAALPAAWALSLAVVRSLAEAAIADGLAVGVKSAGDLQQAVADISTMKREIDTSAVFASLHELSTHVPQTASELRDSLYDVFSSIGDHHPISRSFDSVEA